eukprot:SAG31_NODE_20349_length_577_cov_0.753138_1_plen_143_part_01
MNDYISYPFVPAEVKVLSDYSARAHELGLRVKVYYTTGLEVSDRASEVWISRMLGDEIYAAPSCGYDQPSCGGTAWQVLNLEGNYTPSWQQGLLNGEVDHSTRMKPGGGRWANYWIEGLRYLTQSGLIEGFYSDGAGYTRTTM